MKKHAIWLIVVLANMVALFCAINPWIVDWSTAGLAFFIIEVTLFVVIYLPVVAFQKFARNKSWGASFTTTANVLMDLITGMVP